MNTKKTLSKKRLGILGGTSLLSTLTSYKKASAEASGPSGGGATADEAIANQIAGVIGTYDVPGTYDVYDPATGDYLGTAEIGDIPSTPFLAVWNGEKFVHENDFLFGKPNTVFANYKVGLKNYQAGIGGDTYLFSDTLRADENGKLKMQIRELEPEESYIDKFSIGAIDLKPTEHFVVDGNLEDSYVFDTEEARSIDGEIHHRHAKRNVFTKIDGIYKTLQPQEGDSITMLSGDELIVRVPKAELSTERDTFILVDSHFRDWTLGDQVPFSRLEKFVIQSRALSRDGLVALAGVGALAATLFLGTNNNQNSLAKLLSVPHSYAEYVIGGDFTSRSLVIAAGDSFELTYLQTLFPRYVQATQEVVRIPKEIIARLKDEFLTIRIKATKKHKVRTAFVFQGTPRIPEVTVLATEKVAHSTSGNDYTEQIKEKNGTFLHTIPGDILDVVVKDAPKVIGMTRRYVLRANGFYTRMSTKTASQIGKNWLQRLNPEDRTLLKNLRLS